MNRTCHFRSRRHSPRSRDAMNRRESAASFIVRRRLDQLYATGTPASCQSRYARAAVQVTLDEVKTVRRPRPPAGGMMSQRTRRRRVAAMPSKGRCRSANTADPRRNDLAADVQKGTYGARRVALPAGVGPRKAQRLQPGACPRAIADSKAAMSRCEDRLGGGGGTDVAPFRTAPQS